MAPSPRRQDERLKTEVYDKIPRVACKGLCQDSCSVIPCSQRETDRVEEVAGRDMGIRPVLRCSILNDNGLCDAHAVRPTICRLFGAVRGKLQCPHGCTPERWLTDDEARELLEKADVIGGVNVAARRDLNALITHLRQMREMHERAGL